MWRRFLCRVKYLMMVLLMCFIDQLLKDCTCWPLHKNKRVRLLFLFCFMYVMYINANVYMNHKTCLFYFKLIWYCCFLPNNLLYLIRSSFGFVNKVCLCSLRRIKSVKILLSEETWCLYIENFYIIITMEMLYILNFRKKQLYEGICLLSVHVQNKITKVQYICI